MPSQVYASQVLACLVAGLSQPQVMKQIHGAVITFDSNPDIHVFVVRLITPSATSELAESLQAFVEASIGRPVSIAKRGHREFYALPAEQPWLADIRDGHIVKVTEG